MRRLALLSCAFLCGAAHTAPPKTDAAFAALHDNTLICRNATTGAICQLRLDADGRYLLLYDRGQLEEVPMVGGIFRMEVREGRYTTRNGKDGPQVCLNPAPVPGKVFQTERTQEMFARKGCYSLSASAVGGAWSGTDRLGRRVDFWLTKGRG